MRFRGTQADDDSARVRISANGRFVAFDNIARNLAGERPSDPRFIDVFVHHRQTHTLEQVSVSSAEVPGNGHSLMDAISADGRFVAFQSAASNLVPGDTNGVDDVFVRDRQRGLTERVSVAIGGIEGNAASERAAISGDARFVAFDSLASNLVVGDSNGLPDVFVRDRYLVSPPDTTITSGPAGSTTDPTPTFGFAASPGGARFECRLDSGAFASCSSPHTTGPLSEGRHTFAVRAIDVAGDRSHAG